MYRSHALLLWVLFSPTTVFSQCPALIDAAAKGDINTVSSLLSGGSDPNCVDNSVVKGWTPLMAAAKVGSAAVGETLIKAHANVNAANGYGATALDIAVIHGYSSDVAVTIFVAGGKGRAECPISVAPRPNASASGPIATTMPSLGSPNASDRIAAVAQVTDQSLLTKVALEDENGNVREAAVQKITDQTILVQLATKDVNRGPATSGLSQQTK